jgi:hypothetical protein
MESMFDECKVNNTLNVFKDAKIKAKMIKSLESHTNSLMCPKINLCCNQCTWGAIKVKSKLGKIVNGPIIKDKVITCIYGWKRCSIWNCFQLSEKNYQICVLNFLFVIDSPWKIRKKLDQENNKNMC